MEKQDKKPKKKLKKKAEPNDKSKPQKFAVAAHLSQQEEQDFEGNALQLRKEDLLSQAKEVTQSPGCYLMKDSHGHILYIGKAKNLRNRVTSYFQNRAQERLRVELMVSRVHEFELILTETESEALLLEATLIKKHRPKFNVILKDDKNYPYIRLQIEDAFPRLEWTRRVEKDGALYFGPFASAWSAKQVLYLLNETFKLRDCSDNTFRHRSRPCLLHQIDRCSAPCVAKISAEDYRFSLQEARQVLEGKSEKLLQRLQHSMEKASSEEEFEAAALIRDQIRNLQLITETQGVIKAGSDKNWDVVGIARPEPSQANDDSAPSTAHGTFLQVRNGKLISVKHYRLQNADSEITVDQLLSQILLQHYLTAQFGRSSRTNVGQTLTHPSEVLMSHCPADSLLLEKNLQISIRLPENAEENQLLSVAHANAQHAMELSQRRETGHGFQALEEVQKKLSLPRLPQRIECFDISNIQGEDAVASRVVFIDGAPEKSLYRRYRIRTVEGSNDFAMMKEVLSRRFLNREENMPDLVVVDGGKGQLSQAVAIMEELSIQGVAVVGLAKARTEKNFQEKEVNSSQERIFIPGRKNPLALFSHMAAYRLLVHIRDEAHRFAITYHRHLRQKRVIKKNN